MGKIKSDEELEDLCDLSVRSLDELIDYQDYPIKAWRCDQGSSFSGYRIHWSGPIIWAKLGYKYGDQEYGMLFMDLLSPSSITS